MSSVERGKVAPLTGSLNFHQRAGIGGHDIHVDLGTRILFVRKVETHSSVHDADADGRYATRDGLWVGEQVGGAQVRHGVDQGHVCPRHCRGAGATVGLEDITVEGDGCSHRLPRDRCTLEVIGQ